MYQNSVNPICTSIVRQKCMLEDANRQGCNRLVYSKIIPSFMLLISFERGMILTFVMEKLRAIIGYLVQQVFTQLISPSFSLSLPSPDIQVKICSFFIREILKNINNFFGWSTPKLWKVLVTLRCVPFLFLTWTLIGTHVSPPWNDFSIPLFPAS